MNAEPENQMGNFAFSAETHYVHTMGIQEHAALVEAIMLNFPEIYDEPMRSNRGEQLGARGASGAAIRPSSPT